MTTREDDGRVSMVVERRERGPVSEGAFTALCRALAPAQVLSADLRSVDNGRDGSGGLREVTAGEKAIDRGATTRGRRAAHRVERIPQPHRGVLTWLRDYAHTGDLASLGALCGLHNAPAALIAARTVASLRLLSAERDHAAARKALAVEAPRGTRRPSQKADALRVLVDGHARNVAEMAKREAAAVAALTAWGVAALSDACRAWGEADDEEWAA